MAHTTKSDGDKEAVRTLEKVRIREEAAARCTKVIKIKGIQESKTRKARADHIVKCSMMPGTTMLKRKFLTELWQIQGTLRGSVNGS